MLSKELISSIFDKPGAKVMHSDNYTTMWKYRDEHDSAVIVTTNTSELMLLVKKWAIEYECVMSSATYKIDSSCDVQHPFVDNDIGCGYAFFTGDTEPKAVFKAGEWVLKAINERN